jgi:hypothetical protein
MAETGVSSSEYLRISPRQTDRFKLRQHVTTPEVIPPNRL